MSEGADPEKADAGPGVGVVELTDRDPMLSVLDDGLVVLVLVHVEFAEKEAPPPPPPPPPADEYEEWRVDGHGDAW